MTSPEICGRQQNHVAAPELAQNAAFCNGGLLDHPVAIEPRRDLPLLVIAQPTCLRRPIVEVEEANDAEDDRRQAFQQEERAPAAQAE